MAEPQKSVPKPIKMSFDKKPIRTLKRLRKNKGKVIFHEPSCALKITFLLPLDGAKKAKYNNRVE